MGDHKVNNHIDQLGPGPYDQPRILTEITISARESPIQDHGIDSSARSGAPKKARGPRTGEGGWEEAGLIMRPYFQRDSKTPSSGPHEGSLEDLARKTGRTNEQIKEWYKKRRQEIRKHIRERFNEYYAYAYDDEEMERCSRDLRAHSDFVKVCFNETGAAFIKGLEKDLDGLYELHKQSGPCMPETLAEIAKVWKKELLVVQMYWALRGRQDHDPLAGLHIKMDSAGDVRLNTPYDDAHFGGSTRWPSGVTEFFGEDQEAQVDFPLPSGPRIPPEEPFSVYSTIRNSWRTIPRYAFDMAIVNSIASPGVNNSNFGLLSITGNQVGSATSTSTSQYEPPFGPSGSTAVESICTPNTEITEMSGLMSGPMLDIIPNLPAQNRTLYECRAGGTCAVFPYKILCSAHETWYHIRDVHGILARPEQIDEMRIP